MSLRTKLIGSFVGLSLLMSLSGLIGLIFITSINITLNQITDVAAPTVETSDDLIAAVWKANTIVEAILVAEDPAEIARFRRELIAPTKFFDTAYAELQHLVKDESLIDDLEIANDARQQFIEHSQQAIEQQLLMLSKEANSKQLLVRFDAVGVTLTTMLDEFAIENEEEMQRAEEEGDVLVATGIASAKQINKLLGELFEKDYPVVEASLKLQRLLVELEAVCREYVVQEELAALEPLRMRFQRLFAEADSYIKTLSDLAETEEDRQDARSLKELVVTVDERIAPSASASKPHVRVE